MVVQLSSQLPLMSKLRNEDVYIHLGDFHQIWIINLSSDIIKRAIHSDHDRSLLKSHFVFKVIWPFQQKAVQRLLPYHQKHCWDHCHCWNQLATELNEHSDFPNHFSFDVGVISWFNSSFYLVINNFIFILDVDSDFTLIFIGSILYIHNGFR